MSEILSKLKKVRNLALEGATEGEHEAASLLLSKLLKKYDKSFEEISVDEEVVECRDFYFHGDTERKLLQQIMYKVTDSGASYTVKNLSTGRTSKTLLRCYCTELQKVEIDFLFEFYTKLFWKEHQYFVSAFIQKHKLFGTSRKDTNPVTRSDEESSKIYTMERGLSDDSLVLRVEGEVTPE